MLNKGKSEQQFAVTKITLDIPWIKLFTEKGCCNTVALILRGYDELKPCDEDGFQKALSGTPFQAHQPAHSFQHC